MPELAELGPAYKSGTKDNIINIAKIVDRFCWPCYRYETVGVLAALSARNLSDFRPAGNCWHSGIGHFLLAAFASFFSFVRLASL